MRLVVKRTFVPIEQYSEWEHVARDATVWEWSTGHGYKRYEPPCPKDYVPGLLKCYVNERQVDLETFDAELRKVDWTRAKILRRP